VTAISILPQKDEDREKDNTTATGILPQTGLGKTIFAVIVIITILGVISFIKTRKYKDIR